jgi:hypothetical protein
MEEGRGGSNEAVGPHEGLGDAEAQAVAEARREVLMGQLLK